MGRALTFSLQHNIIVIRTRFISGNNWKCYLSGAKLLQKLKPHTASIFQERRNLCSSYLYILIGNRRPGSDRKKTILPSLVKLIALEFGYDADWIMNGNDK